MQETWVWSLGQKDPLEKEPHSVFLPGNSHGQRSLVGYRPWGRKESDTTERLDNNKGMEKLKTQRSCFSKVAQPARNLGLVETSLMPSPGSLSTWPLSLADL